MTSSPLVKKVLGWQFTFTQLDKSLPLNMGWKPSSAVGFGLSSAGNAVANAASKARESQRVHVMGILILKSSLVLSHSSFGKTKNIGVNRRLVFTKDD